MTTNLQTNNCILLLCFAVFCCLKLADIMSKKTVKPLKTQRLRWFHRWSERGDLNSRPLGPECLVENHKCPPMLTENHG